MQKKKNNDKSMAVRIMSLATVVLILAAGAVLRNGRLFGYDIAASPLHLPRLSTATPLLCSPTAVSW